MRLSRFSKSTLVTALASAASAVVLSGCVVAARVPGPVAYASGPVVYVDRAPPAPYAEQMIVSPGPGHVWIAGNWHWTGRDYVWNRGHWARPAQGHTQWVPGHWRNDHRGHYWVAGHWR